jgi:hypothetical protein
MALPKSSILIGDSQVVLGLCDAHVNPSHAGIDEADHRQDLQINDPYYAADEVQFFCGQPDTLYCSSEGGARRCNSETMDSKDAFHAVSVLDSRLCWTLLKCGLGGAFPVISRHLHSAIGGEAQAWALPVA